MTDKGTSYPRISMSAGVRQKQAGHIIKKVKALRVTLDELERYANRFDDDGEIIPAFLMTVLAEEASAIPYLVGQANGAGVLPDIVDGKRLFQEDDRKDGV